MSNVKMKLMAECTVCGKLHNSIEEASKCCKSKNNEITEEQVCDIIKEEINKIINTQKISYLQDNYMSKNKINFVYFHLILNKYIYLIDDIYSKYPHIVFKSEECKKLIRYIRIKISENKYKVKRYATFIHGDAKTDLDMYFASRPIVQFGLLYYKLSNVYFLRYWYNGLVRDDRVIERVD